MGALVKTSDKLSQAPYSSVHFVQCAGVTQLAQLESSFLHPINHTKTHCLDIQNNSKKHIWTETYPQALFFRNCFTSLSLITGKRPLKRLPSLALICSAVFPGSCPEIYSERQGPSRPLFLQQPLASSDLLNQLFSFLSF